MYRVATLGIFLGLGLFLGLLLSQYTRLRSAGEVPTGVPMDRPGLMGPRSGMEQMEHEDMPGAVRPGPSAQGLAGLEQAVQAEPGNVEHLLALGRVYMDLGRFQEGIETYKEVLAIDARQPEALSTLGVVLFQNGHFDGALAAFDRALDTDPEYPMALWGRGWALFQGKQDYGGAITAWETLQQKNPGWTETLRVERALREARRRQGDAPSPVPAAERLTLSGIIRIAPDLEGRVAPDAVLYIIARSGEGPPLAVKQVPHPTFPYVYSLDRDDVMLPGVAFQGEVSVIARIAQGGSAGPPRPGDMEGVYRRNPARVGEGHVDILIEKIH